MYRNRNVLVTGGTGLIGRPLVELLLEAGAKVRVATIDPYPSKCPDGAELWIGDLTMQDFAKAVVRDIDFVFHVAGIKGSVGIGVSRAASFMVPALIMNTNLMEAARQASVERYLFTSSVAIYPPAQLFREDDAWTGFPHSTDKYAAMAKLVGELQAEAYKMEYGWDRISIIRPANVYGPWDNFDPESAMAVASLIRRVVDGEDPLVVWGDGSVVRDFIYSRDVARGMMLALEKVANCTPINLGGGKGITIKQLVEVIVSLVPKPPRVVWDTSKQTGESTRIMDMSRAKELLGFEPRVSLREGIRETIEWYLANREIADKRYNIFKEENYEGHS